MSSVIKQTLEVGLSEHELLYVTDSPIHGKGLFARRHIEAGSYIDTYQGQETLDNGMHVLWVEVEDGEWVGRNGENILRYLNHSQKPCAEFDGFDLYAAHDIVPDQEITIDYGEDPNG